MSFSYDTKNELCRLPVQKLCCARAEAYGILLFCNTFSATEVRIITENPHFAARLPKLFRRAFNLQFDRQPEPEQEEGKRIFQITDQKKLDHIINLLGFDPQQNLVLHINFGMVEETCDRAAFLRGAFFAGGSITDPQKRYHLELTTSHLQVSRELGSLLQECGYPPKSLSRGGSLITYFKQSDQIEDFLTLIGAPVAAMNVMSAKLEKDLRNSVNRRLNCDSANLDKAVEAAQEQMEAIRRLHIGVKCATITPNLQRQEEYGLSQLWKSPNATIRAALDGTVFRAPILISRVKPVVTSWKKPVTIARHAYGDLYKAVEYRVPGKGKAELVFTDENGVETSRQTVYQFSGPGVVQAMHNRDDSILSFARCCFSYGLSVGQDVWFSSKDTISKDYDQTFKLLFQKVYDEEYRTAFEKAGLTYRYALIDDVAAKVIRSPGGIIWACKNYDGDVMSDLIAAASGSLPMMTSVLVSPDGNFEYEAAHGTVTDHFYRWRRGEKVSTNPLATMAAWAGALRKRGEWDKNQRLVDYADCLNQAGLDVFEEGYLSEDLAALCDPADLKEMPDNDRLLSLIRQRLEVLLAQ